MTTGRQVRPKTFGTDGFGAGDVRSAVTDRATDLREFAGRLVECDGVVDAWTAKSFTDRLFVVEVPPGGGLPDGVRERLHARDLREASEVYDVPGAADADFAGDLADGRRYRFVDVRERGQLQSYVVE